MRYVASPFNRTCCLLAVWWCLATVAVRATEHAGQVSFGGVPVPGASVVASQGNRRVATVTDQQGVYRFPDLPDGAWVIEVDMTGFAPARVEVTVAAGAMPAAVSLTLLSFTETARSAQRAETIEAPPAAPVASSAPARTPASEAPPSDPLMDTADGLLVNGSVNNGAATPFAQAAAFGNNRAGRRSLYNGSMGLVLGHSAWDARPYSFTGDRTARPSYTDLQFLGTFGGPLRIPRVRTRPNVFVGYQRTTDTSASTQSALIPTALEKGGDFSQSGRIVRDPLTGLPFPFNVIPQDRLSAAALSLLGYYPAANLDSGGRYNFQAPVVTASRQDNVQARFTQNLDARNLLSGTFVLTDAQADTTSLLGFTDRSGTGNLDAAITWSKRMSPFFASRVRYQFTRATTDVVPHFANRLNVSGVAGITGNDQDQANWGPPTLSFSDGTLGLTTAQYEETRALTHGAGLEGLWNRPGHSITAGAAIRRISLNALGQTNGRGSLAFTGDVTGLPLADFLLGLPQASAIAYGNADKRLRALAYDAYVTDDWRVSPGLTINAGVRWEYESPFTEEDGRLSNLDVAADFTSATLVTQRSGTRLLQPDRSGIQPRLGMAWRPIAGSSLVVRAGYGVYRNTSTYRPLALLMGQQPPFSKAVSVQRTGETPLTLQDPFAASATGAPATFAIDPYFKVGSAQNWQVLVQRDLPASLTVSAAYLGAAGRNLMQEVLPNTYPAGAANPCPSCPAGFAYLTSTGSSSRHAGQVQVRRRLRNGFTASAQYTLSKSIDDAGAFTGAALSGAAIAQDWRNLGAERGPSNFDQRHLLTAEVQYTSGVGVTGGGLLSGVRGSLVRGWTMTSRITAGSGLPLSPIYLAPVAGTGVTGTLRASRTGASLDAIPGGLYLNPAAFAAPGVGEWGDAGRNSLRGPAQFEMSAGIARSFPWGERVTIDWRIDASNVLNRVTYSTIDTIVGSPQFGAPTRANPMRKLQSTLRFRF